MRGIRASVDAGVPAAHFTRSALAQLATSFAALVANFASCATGSAVLLAVEHHALAVTLDTR